MSRRKRDIDLYEDPIRAAREKERYEHYKNTLFQPILEIDEVMQIRWLVEGLLPLGYLVLLAGCPKAGKTCFATALALAVANGVPFAGRPTRQSSVLWIAAEENGYERQLLLGTSPLAETSTPLYTCYQRLNIEEDETMNILVEWINKTEAKLIVVDPLLGATGGHSLRDSWSARRSLQLLKDLCSLTSATAIVLHHRKRDYLRAKTAVADNAQLAATASMSIVLTSSQALGNPYMDSPSLCPRGTSLDMRKGPGDGVEGKTRVRKSSPPLGEGTCERSELRGGVTGIKGRKSSPPLGEGTCERSELRGGVTVNPRPTQPRIVRLSCEGRGAWANRTQLFYSEGPLDFRPINDEPSALQAENPPTGWERRVLEALVDGVPKTAEEISELILSTGKRVRNFLTNLRRKGYVFVDPGSKWPYKYGLIHANAQFA